MLLFILRKLSVKLIHQHSFNTSHVTLYLISSPVKSISKSRFNTSHVTLYLSERQWSSRHITCFNTSHVTLYRCANTGTVFYFTVSIHLMLLFISPVSVLTSTGFCFNTSHVTLYPSFYRLFFF